MNEQLFPANFILNYIQDDRSYRRFLTYSFFRFLSAAGVSNPDLPHTLADQYSIKLTESDFSLIETFLAEDCYFSPSFTAGTFDPWLLAAAIRIIQDSDIPCTIADDLFCMICPATASADFSEPTLVLTSLITTESDFYGALYYTAAHYKSSLPSILPKFTAIYWEELHFSVEDFVLYDFMDEYFETENCRNHPAFLELSETLVAAVLTYHKTDISKLANHECIQMLSQKSSRFAMIRQFGAVSFCDMDSEYNSRMLQQMFRYAVLYELRSNLFDFHLEEDNLITLQNWKEKLRWHYVQYSNVYDCAMDSFFAAMLSKELLRMNFCKNILS